MLDRDGRFPPCTVWCWHFDRPERASEAGKRSEGGREAAAQTAVRAAAPRELARELRQSEQAMKRTAREPWSGSEDEREERSEGCEERGTASHREER